jgi:hypothetical protein
MNNQKKSTPVKISKRFLNEQSERKNFIGLIEKYDLIISIMEHLTLSRKKSSSTFLEKASQIMSNEELNNFALKTYNILESAVVMWDMIGKGRDSAERNKIIRKRVYDSLNSLSSSETLSPTHAKSALGARSYGYYGRDPERTAYTKISEMKRRIIANTNANDKNTSYFFRYLFKALNPALFDEKTESETDFEKYSVFNNLSKLKSIDEAAAKVLKDFIFVSWLEEGDVVEFYLRHKQSIENSLITLIKKIKDKDFDNQMKANYLKLVFSVVNYIWDHFLPDEYYPHPGPHYYLQDISDNIFSDYEEGIYDYYKELLKENKNVIKEGARTPVRVSKRFLNEELRSTTDGKTTKIEALIDRLILSNKKSITGDIGEDIAVEFLKNEGAQNANDSLSDDFPFADVIVGNETSEYLGFYSVKATSSITTSSALNNSPVDMKKADSMLNSPAVQELLRKRIARGKKEVILGVFSITAKDKPKDPSGGFDNQPWYVLITYDRTIIPTPEQFNHFYISYGLGTMFEKKMYNKDATTGPVLKTVKGKVISNISDLNSTWRNYRAQKPLPRRAAYYDNALQNFLNRNHQNFMCSASLKMCNTKLDCKIAEDGGIEFKINNDYKKNIFQNSGLGKTYYSLTAWKTDFGQKIIIPLGYESTNIIVKEYDSPVSIRNLTDNATSSNAMLNSGEEEEFLMSSDKEQRARYFKSLNNLLNSELDNADLSKIVSYARELAKSKNPELKRKIVGEIKKIILERKKRKKRSKCRPARRRIASGGKAGSYADPRTGGKQAYAALKKAKPPGSRGGWTKKKCICCHKCPNDRSAPNGFVCTNPSHLYWGTKADNTYDQNRGNGWAARNKNKNEGDPKGEKAFSHEIMVSEDKIRDAIKKIILEDAQSESWFGNSFVAFKKEVSKGKDPLKVAKKNLNEIGRGSTRVVFDLPDNDGFVLKIINTEVEPTRQAFIGPDGNVMSNVSPEGDFRTRHGFFRSHMRQSNEWEADLVMQQKFPDVFPKTFEKADDFSWILVEKALPIATLDELIDILGVTNTFSSFARNKKVQFIAMIKEAIEYFKNPDHRLRAINESYDSTITGFNFDDKTNKETFSTDLFDVLPTQNNQEPPSDTIRVADDEPYTPVEDPHDKRVKELISNAHNRKILGAMADLGIPPREFLPKNLGISSLTGKLLIIDASLWEEKKKVR